MTYLKGLFEKRQEVYDEFTAALLEELTAVTSAATTLLGSDLEDRLVWRSVELIDDTIMVAGALEFQLGEKILTEDNMEIEVTAEMQPILNRIVRVGVPVELAATASEQEIVDYLKRLNQDKDAHETDVVVGEGHNVAHDTVADLAGEFRSTGLTEEQIVSMIAFAEQSKGKVN